MDARPVAKRYTSLKVGCTGLSMWGVETRRLEVAKSRFGESKIELWKVSAAFGAAGQSLDYPEGIGCRLGAVLRAS